MGHYETPRERRLGPPRGCRGGSGGPGGPVTVRGSWPVTHRTSNAHGGQATARAGIAGADLVSRLERSAEQQRSDPGATFEPSTHEGQLFPAGGSNPGGAIGQAGSAQGHRYVHCRSAAGRAAPPCRGCQPAQGSDLFCVRSLVPAFPRSAPALPVAARWPDRRCARCERLGRVSVRTPGTVTGLAGSAADSRDGFPASCCRAVASPAMRRFDRHGRVCGRDPHTVTGSPGLPRTFATVTGSPGLHGPSATVTGSPGLPRTLAQRFWLAGSRIASGLASR